MPDVAIVSISVAYTPQEEKTYASSRACTRKLDKVVPKDLVNIWQSQQSTDPKRCPLKRSTGLQFQSKEQAQYHMAPLLYIGYSLPDPTK